MALRDRWPLIELWLSFAFILLLPAAMAFAQVQSPYDVGPTFENVVAGDKYVGAEVAGSGGRTFKLVDGLVEPVSGSIVLVVLEDKKSGGQLAVPTKLIEGESGSLTLAADVGEEVRTRSEALLKSDGLPVAAVNTYLAASFPEHKLPVNRDEPAANAEGLIRFSKLSGLDIVDNTDKEIGNVKTAVINTEHASIAYLLVEMAVDKKLRAIPLGAFEYYYAADAWKINLAGERIAKFPPVSADELPKQLDRGWVEYVAVRFGRNTLQDPVAVEGR